jgi:hypothetical protein
MVLTLLKVDQKYLEHFKVWCWRRLEISWADRVRHEGVLYTAKKDRNILHTKRRNADWISQILRGNCLLKHVIERKIEGRIDVTGRLGRRCKQLLDGLDETRRCWKLKQGAQARTLWRTRFGSGFGPVVRQAAEELFYVYSS